MQRVTEMRRTVARLAVAGALGVGMNAGCAVHPENADHYFTTPETVAAARAIRRGDSRSLEKMIAGGLDVNAGGREGMDLLKWSMGRFCLECFETLLEHGADIDRLPAGKYAGKIEQLFLMPVMDLSAQMLHRIENVRLLVKAGADINARARLSQATPLHTAVAVDHYDIAHYLLEQGADSTLEDSAGHTIADDIKMFKDRGVGDKEMHAWYAKVVERLGLDIDAVTIQ